MKTKKKNGFLTVEFSVAILISVALSVLFFVMAFTLSSTLVAQYIAFSVGRIYSGGNITVAEQENLAKQKFTKLMGTAALGKWFSKDWFKLDYDAQPFRSGVSGQIFPEYNGDPAGLRLTTTGVRLIYETKLFNLKLGPLGSTNPQDMDFKAKVTGFMLRNPNQDECQKFMNVDSRHRALIELDQRFSEYDRQPGSNPKYLPMEDNGC